MKFNKFLQRLVVTGCMGLLLVIGTSQGAHASAVITSSPSDFDTPEVREFFTKYGVELSVQDRLIESMENGLVIDSLSAAETPVRTYEIERNGFLETVNVFDDGSISVTGLQIPTAISEGSIMPLAVDGCTYVAGTGFVTATGCTVWHTSAYATLQFIVSYQRTASYTGCKVYNEHSGSISSTIGSISNKTLTIVRGTATSSLPAVVTLHGLLNGPVSEDLYLSLRVNPSQVWTTTY